MHEGRVKRDRLRDEREPDMLIQIWLYRLALLLMMAGVCWLKALPIPFLSEGCLAVLCAYALALIVLQDLYRACAIGQARVSELVVSQMLANLLSTAILYLGAVLYVHRLFNPLWLIVVMTVQNLFGIGWSLWINRSYFRQRRKPRTVVLCQSEADYELLCQTRYFFEKYDVIRVITELIDDGPSLRAQLKDCEVVFTMNTPATYAHSVAKLCVDMGIVGYFAPSLGHIVIAGAQHKPNFSVPMLRVDRAGGQCEYRMFKRVFDVFCSAIGLIVLSPVMLLTAIAIWAEDRGPVFYRQVRLTKNGREFRILKFRSMKVNAEADGVARLAGEKDERITRVGRFIRACRIDELPQLVNILLGDMSLVGPRPERPEIARKYEETLPEFALRLQVKAGLTGFSQVYGRYNTEPYNKLQMDLMYINEMSFLKDMQLILATLRILFVKESTQGVPKGQERVLAARSTEEEKVC